MIKYDFRYNNCNIDFSMYKTNNIFLFIYKKKLVSV